MYMLNSTLLGAALFQEDEGHEDERRQRWITRDQTLVLQVWFH